MFFIFLGKQNYSGPFKFVGGVFRAVCFYLQQENIAFANLYERFCFNKVAACGVICSYDYEGPLLHLAATWILWPLVSGVCCPKKPSIHTLEQI